MTLNPEQEKAVNHIEGPLLVIAGAGSGKTKIVTSRIANLISQGILPTDILAVTFTNKAAKEMQQRIKKLTSFNVHISTFHSLGAKILRESISALGYTNSFSIYDEDDSIKLIKSCLKTLNLKDEKGLSRTIKNKISNIKNELLNFDDVEKEYKDDKTLLDVFPIYQRRLKEYNAVDFDDLLYLPVKLFQEHEDIKKEYQNRWLFVLIDEYQDTNKAQYVLTKLLVAKHQNICVVGDPDQSIYSWRGARYENILNFDKDFPSAKIINLEHNYRSSNIILSAANALIKNNENRFEKNLYSTIENGEKIKVYLGETDKEEAKFVINQIIKINVNENIPFSDCVIFYRTNAQSRTFEDLLLKNNISYIIYGGISFYERKEIKDILAFLRLVQSSNDFLSFARVVNIPKRGIGAKTIEYLQNLCQSYNLPILDIFNSNIDIKLSEKQKQSLIDFVNKIKALRKMVIDKIKISDLIMEIISTFSYLEYLKEDLETFEDRSENIDEFIAKAVEFEDISQTPTLLNFLEELALFSKDTVKDEFNSIKLMTLHNSKGLEFSAVFMTGMEEDIFPHISAKDNAYELEEERRLCYVGMTRAKKILYLTASIQRYMFKGPKIMTPSRFISEIPKEYTQYLTPINPYIMSKPKSSEISYNYEEEKTDNLNIGSKVIHRVFGRGTIKKIYHTSLGDTYDVFFETSRTTRSLVAKYAKLKKI